MKKNITFERWVADGLMNGLILGILSGEFVFFWGIYLPVLFSYSMFSFSSFYSYSFSWFSF